MGEGEDSDIKSSPSLNGSSLSDLLTLLSSPNSGKGQSNLSVA